VQILLTFNNFILEVSMNLYPIETNFSGPICYKSMKETLNLRKGSDRWIGDIYTGAVYTEHVKANRLGQLHQLSYSLCTDGVK
jgi:hypothetical protein